MRSYLKKLRSANNVSQVEVASKIGISQNYYSEIENQNRKKKIDLVLLAKLSSVFDVPINELIAEETKLQSTALQ